MSDTYTSETPDLVVETENPPGTSGPARRLPVPTWANLGQGTWGLYGPAETMIPYSTVTVHRFDRTTSEQVVGEIVSRAIVGGIEMVTCKRSSKAEAAKRLKTAKAVAKAAEKAEKEAAKAEKEAARIAAGGKPRKPRQPKTKAPEAEEPSEPSEVQTQTQAKIDFDALFS